MMRRCSPQLVLATAALVFAPCGHAQNPPDYEQPPSSYSTSTPQDAVARLQQRIAAGQFRFAGSDKEIVQALLAEFKIPVASQVVVFSKTSLQRGRIRPDHPRALYFSDSAYIGWVPGGLIEITAIDPQLGPVFYAFDPREGRSGTPKFERDSDCLRCHGGAFVRDIPGVFARSLFPNDEGEPLLRHGSQVVDDQTPFEERWGGWYVTGYTGSAHHRGNTFATEKADQLVFTPNPQRPTELSAFFETAKYLAPTSDVIALLVLEHQMAVQNSLTRAGNACRKMLVYQHSLQTSFGEPLTEEPAYDSVKSVFASSVQDVVDRLLFWHEAPLPEAVGGGETFKTAFAAGAQRTGSGLSLRDFKLQGHIFAHRCSFMIYTEAFGALPPQLKTRVLDRLHAALASRDPKDRYAYLPAEEKQRIRDILVETLPDAKKRWSEQPVAQSQ